MPRPVPIRFALLVAAALLALPQSAAAAEEGAAALRAERPRGNRACLTCHTHPLFDATAFSKSVHGELSCSDCHEGYDFSSGHAAQPPDLDEKDKAFVEKLGAKSDAPRAVLACRNCHEEAFEQLIASIHGRWLREERPVAGPACADCHGSPHAIAPTEGSRAAVHALSEQCVACHSDPKMIAAAGIAAHPAAQFRDSLHGRQLALGNLRAPNCADCHGSHAVQPPANPASTVGKEQKVQTCARCHAGANETFAALVTHTPLAQQTNPWPRYIHTAFSWLTTLTLLALFLHILLDALTAARRRFLRTHGHAEPPIPARLPRAVGRFDIHQRIQHWLLIAGVILLVLTGWPLRAATLSSGRGLSAALGGPEVTSFVHRAAAFLLIAASIYHVAYLVALARKRKLQFSMLPTPKDLRDVYENLLFMFGARDERPKFGKYSYIEKFDYWAVFWGIAIMVSTGFVYWFPIQFTNLLPSSLVMGAQLAHGEEATLAALALFVWHFYNVHLRPAVFPMSWTWLDGKIPIEMLREEHGLEYENLLKGEQQRAGTTATGKPEDRG